jgi:polyisoprenoid-binding protein YceI
VGRRLTLGLPPCYPTRMAWNLALRCLVIACLSASPALAETPRWVPVSSRCFISVDVDFAPGAFSGLGREVSGEFQANPWNLSDGVSGQLTVRVASLSTGLDGRDKEMLKALAAEKYPTMAFVIQAVTASFPSVSEHADVLLTIQGRLTIAGVDRVKRFSGRVRWKDNRLWVRGETRFKMTDFRIKPPTYLLLSVKDEVGVGFDLLLDPKDGSVLPPPPKPSPVLPTRPPEPVPDLP